MIYNYRGYGLSEGEPSKNSILSDTKEIYEKFLDKDSVLIGIHNYLPLGQELNLFEGFYVSKKLISIFKIAQFR